MLTVKVEENYEPLLEEMGIAKEDGMFVMAMREKDLLMGIGVVKIFDGFASLHSIVMKEEFKGFDLEFGMGKSLLNFLDLRGIQNVVTNIDNERLVTALRFKSAAENKDLVEFSGDWKKCLNLTGYFLSNC